jgi:hypothetical protein
VNHATKILNHRNHACHPFHRASYPTMHRNIFLRSELSTRPSVRYLSGRILRYPITFSLLSFGRTTSRRVHTGATSVILTTTFPRQQLSRFLNGLGATSLTARTDVVSSHHIPPSRIQWLFYMWCNPSAPKGCLGGSGRRCVCKATRGRGALAGSGQGFHICLQCHEMPLAE